MIAGKFTSCKDLEVFRDAVPPLRPEVRRYVGLDFGGSCGLAFCDLVPGQKLKDVTIYMELLDLSLGTFDSSAPSVLATRAVSGLNKPVLGNRRGRSYPFTPAFPPGVKMSPAVVLARSAGTTELFGALKYFTQTWAERRNLPFKGYGIGEIKKYATGKGSASKVLMTAACNKRFGTNFDPRRVRRPAPMILLTLHMCWQCSSRLQTGLVLRCGL